MEPIVQQLVNLIDKHHWKDCFQAALDHAAEQQVLQIEHVRTVEDYLRYIDEMVRWAPRESGDSQMVHDKLVEFHFILDQPPLLSLQSPIKPNIGPQKLTPLSQWISDYAVAWGSYLDSPSSVMHVETFRTNPAFHWNDYMPPPSGYKTFNQFFARHVRPGRRPIAAPEDACVVVSPPTQTLLAHGRSPMTPRSL